MKLKEKESIVSLHLETYGKEEGELVSDLASKFLELKDTISISIKREDKIIANVLFTPFIFTEQPNVKCYLLAPLAVLPKFQGTGIGRELMKEAIQQLKAKKTDAIFVLGVPTFYPKFGFVITDKQTPYPAFATGSSWMALELTEGVLQKLGGKTIAVNPFMNPIFWDTSQWGD